MIIYKATNKINGKCYIGQTRNSLEIRISQHVSSKSLNKLEKKYIKKYNSHADNKGYNLTYGGDGILSYQHTDETKQLISEATKNHWKDPEYRKKVNTPERNKKIGKKLSIISQNRWNDPAIREKWIKALTKSAQSRRKQQSEIMKKLYSDIEERQKQADRLSKNWLITDPNGNTMIIKNRTKFCIENNIDDTGLYRTSKNIQETYKGWRCIEIVERKDGGKDEDY